MGIQNSGNTDNFSVVGAKDDNHDGIDNEFGSNDELLDVQLTNVEVPISYTNRLNDFNLIEAKVPIFYDIKEEIDDNSDTKGNKIE